MKTVLPRISLSTYQRDDLVKLVENDFLIASYLCPLWSKPRKLWGVDRRVMDALVRKGLARVSVKHHCEADRPFSAPTVRYTYTPTQLGIAYARPYLALTRL